MFGKYEFETKEQAQELIEELKDTGDGIVELGFIQVEPPTFYKNGKVNKQAVLNKGYSIDVLWKENENESWTPYRILLGKMKSSHEFAGVKYYEGL